MVYVFLPTEEGICPNESFFTHETGMLSCVMELVVAGPDVNGTCECHGNGLLHSAAVVGRVDYIKLIIHFGANVNIQNKGGSIDVYKRY